jgi:hypothetical protein
MYPGPKENTKMFDYLLYPAIIFVGTVYTWMMYLAVMTLMENKKELTLVAKIFAYPVAGIGILFDVAVNVIVGSIIFLELPRQFLFTQRLQFWIDDHFEGKMTWRAHVANFICNNFLDPFDPKGYHCRKK